MALVDEKKKGHSTVGVRNSGSSRLQPRITLASIESLTMPLVQEVVLLADFRCARCQQRVAEIMSRMNGEMEFVEVSLAEKKVTMTCRYPRVLEVPVGQVSEIYRNPLNKFTMILRLFRSSCS